MNPFLFLILTILFLLCSPKLTNDEDENDLIFNYINSKINFLLENYEGKYGSFTSHYYAIADSQDSAFRICKALPEPCIPYLIINHAFFVGYSEILVSSFTTKNQSEFEKNLSGAWFPQKKLTLTKIDYSDSGDVNFLVDSGASMTYIGEADATNLHFGAKDCKYYVFVSGIIQGKEKLCVVEIFIDVKDKMYKTYAQIGNSKTSQTNLLGRYKFFDYFKISIELARKKTEIIQSIDKIQEKQIREEL